MMMWWLWGEQLQWAVKLLHAALLLHFGCSCWHPVRAASFGVCCVLMGTTPVCMPLQQMACACFLCIMLCIMLQLCGSTAAYCSKSGLCTFLLQLHRMESVQVVLGSLQQRHCLLAT